MLRSSGIDQVQQQTKGFMICNVILMKLIYDKYKFSYCYSFKYNTVICLPVGQVSMRSFKPVKEHFYLRQKKEDTVSSLLSVCLLF